MGAGTARFLWLTNIVVEKMEGENDGLLTPAAVQWGNFKGAFRGVGKRGISHRDEVDVRRRPLSVKTGTGVSNITDVYKNIVIDLQRRGF